MTYSLRPHCISLRTRNKDLNNSKVSCSDRVNGNFFNSSKKAILWMLGFYGLWSFAFFFFVCSFSFFLCFSSHSKEQKATKVAREDVHCRECCALIVYYGCLPSSSLDIQLLVHDVCSEKFSVQPVGLQVVYLCSVQCESRNGWQKPLSLFWFPHSLRTSLWLSIVCWHFSPSYISCNSSWTLEAATLQ